MSRRRPGRLLHAFGWPAVRLVVVSIATTACAPVITSLATQAPLAPWPTGRFPATVTVERFAIQDGGDLRRDPETMREQFDGSGLVQVLNDHRVFARAIFSDADERSTDLVLRGEIVARWNPRGADNFFTWWPGGLVLTPNWYGTRMEYCNEALVDLVDQRTGDRLATYNASTAYGLVHRSATPGPFFAAAIIVPAVVKGARMTRPPEVYKNLMYPLANGRLWEEIASQIIEERSPVYAAAAAAQRQRCGDRLNRPPRIGEPWSEFVDCQSTYFELGAQVELADGYASVFVDVRNGMRISVLKGAIVRWENPVTIPGRGAPPR